MKPAILTDITKCKGCEACVWACKEINKLPTTVRPTRLSAESWTAVDKRHGANVRRQCMHCLEPACASVCPVGALRKTAEGPVVYDADKCIGCRYCMVGCPFKIPKYDWNTPLPTVKKCILCFEKRLAQGLPPACTAACPTGATIFGDRDALIAEARARIRDNPQRYVDHIYGLEEAGGTSVLYLAGAPFATLGFGATTQSSPYPAFTWAVLSKLPNVVSVGGVLLLGFWWLTQRKEVLARVRNGEITFEEARRENPHLFGAKK